MEEISDSNKGRNRNTESPGASTKKRKILDEQSFEFQSSQPHQSCELIEEIADSNQGRNQNKESPGRLTKKQKSLHEESFELQSFQTHQSCELTEEVSNSNQGSNQNISSPGAFTKSEKRLLEQSVEPERIYKKVKVNYENICHKVIDNCAYSKKDKGVVPGTEISDSNKELNQNIESPGASTKKRKRLDEQSFETGCIYNKTTLNYGNNCHTVSDNCTSSHKYKGVVPQQNGHWGAQLYTNNQRIWLGTFKSALDAAIAYDRASIKLRSSDAQRNFPWSKRTDLEAKFQSPLDMDTILAMIKDGSYESKLNDFLRRKTDKENDEDLSVQKNCDTYCRLLFEKELTPSDVGKLNRLVIPKKYAVAYFPPVPDKSEGFANDEVMLPFLDVHKNLWKFRYCYWKSSQSFVFTRGWNLFVKENGLTAKDKIFFYYKEDRRKTNSGYLEIGTSLPPTSNIGVSLKLDMETQVRYVESKEDEGIFEDRKPNPGYLEIGTGLLPTSNVGASLKLDMETQVRYLELKEDEGIVEDRKPNPGYLEIGTSLLPASNIGASLKLDMETQVRYVESKEDEGIVEDQKPNPGYLEIGTSLLPASNIGASLKHGMETQVRYMESKEDEGIVEDREMSDEVIQNSNVETKGFKLFGVQIAL